MEFDHVRKGSRIPNLTPLIDIVFLLLIFFMLTAHFVQDEAIKINLPEASGAEEVNETKIVKISIDKNDNVFLDDESVDLISLEPKLVSALKSHENKSVQIRGDNDSGLGIAVSILDMARRAGATDVDIITKRP
ncbi:Biopolymer transport protein ExbD/TolR [hydrothermal vent metagenome]|uniref:Biopolymer transport protein ExbD/TolR n=1 Tax=hydrothermal vent metagenome TaxID=652676 RepID=A0A3B1BGU3_9ZZZZ